ncbi:MULTISPECIES: hypothetical protein [unclassified Burkholderia]|uniref:hypothetical protein n=1 Tax=unclassified Burkholderia TaxID=2613784 RepID=UPI00142060E6|nr:MULTISPECIES: hypothetical protein [unclassified Burkholderia]NIE81960.1 hypothetical protein [Burkholderia sp. Tr-860]NIF61740.1 hypothetical protein [Burkholderia sp. Cy-647]NIF94051.1 hypothetical protein [Burkholderia sp. Ax-1720]
MIDLQRPLSPILAALLLKEFSDETVSEWAAIVALGAEGETVAMNRFFTGLDEHRLDLRSEDGCELFCDVVLGYLESLLDPGTSLFVRSGIQETASSATTVWDQMSDMQQTGLWREAARLHAVVVPLVFK